MNRSTSFQVMAAAAAMLSMASLDRAPQPLIRNARDSSKPGGSNPKARKRQAKRNAVKAARRRNRK